MNIYSVWGIISPWFRKRRMKQFERLMKPTVETRILDVGGYPWFWLDASIRPKITILNPHMVAAWQEQFQRQYKLIVGDGTKLCYRDREFEIVFSNSVIEHLQTFEQQRKFAAEARRVGKRVWIQTPAKSFFLEPHLLTPFVHWLPKSLQFRLARYFTLWGWIARPTKEQAFAYVDELRLLTEREMKALFPDCEIIKEKLFGITKSYVAVRQS